MGRRGKNAILCGVIALLLVGAIALPVNAAGTGIALAPSIYEINGALRGADYDRSLVITNMGEETTDYVLAAEGDASDWLSFSSNGGTIQQVTVPARSQETFVVGIAVPGDAANGEHQATISVTSIPKSTGSGISMALRALSQFSIMVTGTQIIEASVSGINTEDIEVGYPLEIQVFVQNTGNVEVTPIITANITANENAIGNVVKNDTKVRAGAGEYIIVEWDTTGNPAADYLAMVAVTLDGRNLATKQLPFKILPLGTLTRLGELKGIVINDAPLVNLLTKMTATFKNTGQIDTWAEFSGEIYKGDQLVDTFTGEKLLIGKGTEGKLVAYFKLAEIGEYTIKGWVVFEGKKTETMELAFEVIVPQTGNIAEANPPDEVNPGGITIVSTDKGLAAYLYVIIGLAGAAAIAAAYLFIWRKKQFVPVFVGSYNKVFKELAHNKLFKRFKFNMKRTKHNGKK